MKTERKLKLLKTAKIAVKTVPVAVTVLSVVASGSSISPLNIKDDSPWTAG